MVESSLIVDKGSPHPLGATRVDSAMNFAIYAPQASTLSLCLFQHSMDAPAATVQLNRSGDIWHCQLNEPDSWTAYSYRVNEDHDLLDPYAKQVIPRYKGPLKVYSPLAAMPKSDTFDWGDDKPLRIPSEELIIYEMHVGGFTRHSSSEVRHPGTFLGMIEKIPYLVDLGINAVELMPIFEFDPHECPRSCVHSHGILGNFWGYSTINFFSPAACLTATKDPKTEFRQLVKALHQAGIEVFLDVVYNHTAEGDERGPILSYKELANTTYYMLNEQGKYLNFSGCGNTFNCNHPVVQQLVLDSLCYWAEEMHVDGFRFDLTSCLTRDPKGAPLAQPPLLEAIVREPKLSHCKLIAEPWDAGGLYEMGGFAYRNCRWSEWNGRYRDALRRFIKGDLHSHPECATRMSGSQDIYVQNGSPANSINFITAHDGFSLTDAVSYQDKHNLDNGEGNRDGNNDNLTWNCGKEGMSRDASIKQLRERQRANFLLALLTSQGIPMLLMGDEYGHTKKGNNNPWCIDDSRNWFQWDQLHANHEWHALAKSLIALRRTHPLFKRTTFYSSQDIIWHGLTPNNPYWEGELPVLAFTLKDAQTELYLAFNATDREQRFTLPKPTHKSSWAWYTYTAEPFRPRHTIEAPHIDLCARSAAILSG